jgi:hypothetical protein
VGVHNLYLHHYSCEFEKNKLRNLQPDSKGGVNYTLKKEKVSFGEHTPVIPETVSEPQLADCR